MPEHDLVPISLDGYVAFFGALIVVIAALFWYLQRKERQARKQFFSKFEDAELRMSPYQIGLVYRVTNTDENAVSVVRIWRGKSQVVDAKQQTLDASQLIPFDETRFF
ncbi:hypothetical protein [uncultured Roseobacter sp.]|uniref:hypothetical protein n=1 Tax=uncultured Roseobacter sp. TaxID=114847 RepID=UPI002632CBF3|nr:hypothetical protein [uncultured Roseobacter sp.]